MGRYVKPVLGEEEAAAGRTVLRAVLDGRLLVEHDEQLIAHVIEAFENAAEVPPPTARRTAGARTGDPSTSKRAAELVAPQAASQRGVILREFVRAAERGLTGHEVEEMLHIRGSWKRVSDLKREGWIADSGKERTSIASGKAQRVHVATVAARVWASERELVSA